MASEAYNEDVYEIAQSLLYAYYIGSDLYGSLPEGSESEELDFTLSLSGTTLRPILATVNALQLALDAAAVAVEYVEIDGYAGDRPIQLGVLHEFAAGEPLVDLEILELGFGSFLARFSVNPKSSHGRRRILAIGTLAALALTPLLGPIPGMLFGGATALNEVLTPDQRQTQPSTPLRTVDPAQLPHLPEEGSLELAHRPAA